MKVLRFERVSKIYPTGQVLKEVTWEIKEGERIGLVGVNGAGKSTQLKIIAGLEDVTSGQVIKQGNPIIAFLKQEFDVNPDLPVREELFQAFSLASQVLTKLRLTEQEMVCEEAANNPDHLDKLIKNLGFLQNEFESLHGYELEAKVEKLLPRIGFSSEDGNKLVREFSGGWQMRIALGKILLQDPDLLLLDEPTNHLDLDTIKWLEDYLLNQSSAMVIISHDRAFLDKICTQIVSIENGIARSYFGNYSSYIDQKNLEEVVLQSSYERQQKEIAEQQIYIDRFRASANRSTQAKSREKLLSKIEKIELPDNKVKKPTFYFQPAPRSGSEVLNIRDLIHSYGEKILFLGANLSVKSGERIAFLGPNGSGKSTLLRLIMGIEKADDGLVSLGLHNILPGYFEQNQAEALDLKKIVVETLFEVVPDWSQTKVRSLLGNFGFSNDSVFKEVGQLSGGEKARLSLALMLVKPCNLLVLDEPTNHLDIPAKQMLEEALADYSGSALIVSHDRYFISKVANMIVEIRDGELHVYRGDYSYYLEKRKQEKELMHEKILIAQKEAKRLKNNERQRKRKNIKRN